MVKIEDLKKRAHAPEITAVLAGRRVGLCGYDAPETRRISNLLARFEVSAIPFDERLLPESARFCDAVLFKLSTVGVDLTRIAATVPAAPILVTGNSQDILEGASGAYLWSRDFIGEPWSDSELVVRLFRLIHAASMDPAVQTVTPRTGPMVLMADDDPEMIALAEVTLRNDGITCKMAGDGVSALQLARQHRPDLIVLDVKMPGINGFEVLETIRLDPRLQILPVVMLTGCDEPDNIKRGARLEADEYLSKPISPVRLLSRVKRVLSNHERLAPRWIRPSPSTLHFNEATFKPWIRS